MKRRLFLKGVAGASLAVPFLPSLHRKAHAQTTPPAPKRLVIFYTNNGCLTNRWFPKVENGALTADALAGTTLAGLAPVASKLLFPRGLAMFPRGMINGYFDPHDQGMGSKLTCAPIDPDTTVNTHYATARSLDHVAAEMVNPGTKTPLVLSVGFASTNVKSIVSYSAPNTPYAPEVNARNVYNSLTGLFSSGTMSPADYRVLQGNSVMDLVKRELDAWKTQNMSAADKQRLDAWQSLLRQTEQKVVSASCNATNATALGITAQTVQAAGGRDTATAFQMGGDMMLNLIALTMMCDANRVIIMQWPGFAKFTWLSYNGQPHQYDHHGLSHRNGSAAVGGTCVTGVIDMIGQIDAWYAERYVKLVNLVNGITEGDRTMLDNSAVMWLPELADGNAHNNNNLPIVIAGGAGGYLKQGVSVNLDTAATLGTGNSEAACGTSNTFGNSSSRGGSVPLNKLYVTLLNAIGQGVPGFTPVTSFGSVDSNDVTKGITNPGELAALKA